MNSHLNIFKTYAKENRRYQLENDLTRALAICLQENSLFFNEFLKATLNSKYASELFNDLYSSNEVSINIQTSSSEINGFKKIFAVSLSEHLMLADHFWNQNYEFQYDPICDIVIKINNVLIIIEAKRDNVDCTAQLYNQIFNICKSSDLSSDEMKKMVTPVDMNWQKLMEIAVKVHSFEKAAGSSNRFLNDFINLVKEHNFRWLPEPSIFSVSPNNIKVIEKRIDSALNELVKKNIDKSFKKLDYNGRLGLKFDQLWAQEILFNVEKNGDLSIIVYPGNTKSQGYIIFHKEPKPKTKLTIDSITYDLSKSYHVKFTSFQRYFSGLFFGEKDLRHNLYSKDNFDQYCGRKKRGPEWESIAKLFDDSFYSNFDWRKQCSWEEKIINSGRNQFDMSFGYELSIRIPFEVLRMKDQNKSDLSNLAEMIENIYKEFRTIYS